MIRQQFAKMIVKSLGYEVPSTIPCQFTDVDPTPNPDDPLYPAKYVAICALHRVTVGKTATTFEPYSSITGQQLIVMVARAADPPEPASGLHPTLLICTVHPGGPLPQRPQGRLCRSA